ncbi:MAG TPA: hypothetical protein VHD56_19665 [Tepidisphaeraceae bacterium]|nr:hypothetical protein [Tepidisphaeraceae bacterium]
MNCWPWLISRIKTLGEAGNEFDVSLGRPFGKLGMDNIDFYIPADLTGIFREKMEFAILVRVRRLAALLPFQIL